MKFGKSRKTWSKVEPFRFERGQVHKTEACPTFVNIWSPDISKTTKVYTYSEEYSFVV